METRIAVISMIVEDPSRRRLSTGSFISMALISSAE